MSYQTIETNLKERFSIPLKEYYNRRIIFWHDEDQSFTDVVDLIQLDNVKIVKLTGTNNFEVKKLLTIDDLQNNYLIYNPISYDNSEDNWLLDIELYSEEYRADDISMKMSLLHVENTPKMRKAMVCYKKFFENEKRVSTLRKMGKKYNSPLDLHIDIIGVLCDVKVPSFKDIVISVLSNSLDFENNVCIKNIKKFGNINAFNELLLKYTGYNFNDSGSLNQLAKHILITALANNIGNNQLKGLEQYINDTTKPSCYDLVKYWIDSCNNSNLQEIMRTVHDDLHLGTRFNTLDIEILAKADVFTSINEIILTRFFTEINDNVLRIDLIFQINDKRRTSSWIDLTKDYFDCLYYIAKMESFYREFQDKFDVVEPTKLLELYTESAYKFDTYYRKFHLAFNKTKLISENSNLNDLLKQSAQWVETSYQNWYLEKFNNSWTKAISKDLSELGYVGKITKQRDFYKNYVKSGGSKVFVIISDALRYEVAKELLSKLIHETNGSGDINAMQSIFPSTTEFGMARLLPNKEISVKEDMKVLVDGYSSDGRNNREKILKLENTKSVALKFEDLSKMQASKRRESANGMEVIYIYHDTIDAIGDKAPTQSKVFEACQTAIDEITWLIKTITNDMNGTNILITSDHGFLYTYQPLDETQRINKSIFKGDIYKYSKRYVLASDVENDYLTRINMSKEIKGLEMVGYSPVGTTRIQKSGGGENFVHGGISIQEMIVPVITYKNIRVTSKKFKEVKSVELVLLTESNKITNLIFSLEFLQKTPLGEKIIASTYSLYFIDSNGEVISDKQSIIADKSSEDTKDRIFRVNFHLKQLNFDRKLPYKLVIKNEIDEPIEIDFEIDIIFQSNFDFDFD